MSAQERRNMFDDIKSRLGFGGSRQDDYYDEPVDDYDDYDDYDEFAEYAEDSYGDEYGSSYDRYAPVTTRSSHDRSGSMPRLVSFDDVRSSTQQALNSSRDALSGSRSASSARTSSFGRTMVDSSLPPQMTPEGTAAASAAATAKARRRSEGLDSLFESTADKADKRQDSYDTQSGSERNAVSDRFDSTSSQRAETTSPSYVPQRTLNVIKPHSYDDVQCVPNSLKKGEAVILLLQEAPGDLSKRLLDFSFGVACALDAEVECIGEKAFAITCGAAISHIERMSLRNQGVIQ